MKEENIIASNRGQSETGKWNRRALMASGTGAVAFAARAMADQAAHSDDEGVTAPEDLMKEHGVLNRCRLVYEEAIRRVEARQEVAPDVFRQTAGIVRHFVEEYHERNEENYIFPVFRKAGKLTNLVDTLLTQHKAGRVLTEGILGLSGAESFRDPANRTKIVALCPSFIRM